MPMQAQGGFEVPSHVPAELVRSLGIIEGPEFLAAPHRFLANLHKTQPPVFYDVSPQMGGQWQLIKHADAFSMLRNPQLFTNEGATPFPRDPAYPFKFIPIEIEPPEHRKYRRILDPIFSPQGVLKLDGYIRKRANDLIDRFIDKRACEFATDFGRPLPVTIFLDLMALPQEKRDTFVQWAVDLLHSQDRATMAGAMKSITEYLRGVIAERTRKRDDGVISRIIHAEIDGRPMSEIEAFGFVVFLFIGGLDTVYATLNNIWLWLARNPQRRKEIIARPSDIMAIVEELLRVWSVTFSGRTAVQDTEIRGVKIKNGDKVVALLPACNYDPDVFPNPTETDFGRTRKPVCAFGVGVHSCMGAHLARLEIKVALQEWLRRIPDFSVKPGAEIVYRPGGVIGPKSVPLVW